MGTTKSYKSDRNGRVVAVVDSLGIHTNGFSEDGNIAFQSLPQAPNHKLEYQADNLGRRTGITLSNTVTGVAAYDVGFNYDNAGRLAEVRHHGGTVTYSYAADGTSIFGKTYSNGTTCILVGTNSFDGLNRVLALGWGTPVGVDSGVN